MTKPAAVDRITCVPLQLYSRGLDTIAKEVFEHMNSPATRHLLAARHLPGVLRRHRVLSDSEKTLARAAREAKRGGLAALAIMDMETEYCLGLATARPIALRRPRNATTGVLPAWLTRRSGHLSQQLFPEGPNVMAWVAAETEFSQTDALMVAYSSACRLVAGGRAWTVEPVSQEPVQAALREVHGMQELGEPARYDDTAAPFTPPKSVFWQYVQPKLPVAP
jgi:hypothetical protein